MTVTLVWEGDARTGDLYLGEFIVATVAVDRGSARARPQDRTFIIQILLPGARAELRSATMAAARAVSEQAVTAWVSRAGLE